jgi:hypothetical protein
MKFSAILALAATALAATTPQADMNNMEAQAAAPQGGAEPAGAQPQHGGWPQPPQPPVEYCTPGTYSCTPNRRGWRVCGTSHRWVVSFSPSSALPPKY